ncbi:MAG: hypothetical protein KME26_26585 [Oscillatoria princeps RMCB-10]|nr:hypothetical protein [Oscillatoria princeps RMCB-10]
MRAIATGIHSAVAPVSVAFADRLGCRLHCGEAPAPPAGAEISPLPLSQPKRQPGESRWGTPPRRKPLSRRHFRGAPPTG